MGYKRINLASIISHTPLHILQVISQHLLCFLTVHDPLESEKRSKKYKMDIYNFQNVKNNEDYV